MLPFSVVTAESLLGREFYEPEQPSERNLSRSVKISPVRSLDRELELNESSSLTVRAAAAAIKRFDLMLHRLFDSALTRWSNWILHRRSKHFDSLVQGLAFRYGS